MDLRIFLTIGSYCMIRANCISSKFIFSRHGRLLSWCARWFWTFPTWVLQSRPNTSICRALSTVSRTVPTTLALIILCILAIPDSQFWSIPSMRSPQLSPRHWDQPKQWRSRYRCPVTIILLRILTSLPSSRFPRTRCQPWAFFSLLDGDCSYNPTVKYSGSVHVDSGKTVAKWCLVRRSHVHFFVHDEFGGAQCSWQLETRTTCQMWVSDTHIRSRYTVRISILFACCNMRFPLYVRKPV